MKTPCPRHSSQAFADDPDAHVYDDVGLALEKAVGLLQMVIYVDGEQAQGLLLNQMACAKDYVVQAQAALERWWATKRASQ
jgi:hypothetical protein